MIRILFIFALALLPEGLFAQAASPAAPKSITKVIRVHYGDPHSIANILHHVSPVNVDWDGALKAVILHGGPSDVAIAEQTIKELDLPPAVSTTGDIELIVYVVGGSNEPITSSSNKDLSTIEPVVKQLRAIFPYKGYALLSTMFMRSQQGSVAESSGLIEYPFGNKSSSRPDNYHIYYHDATVSSDKAKTVIHLADFRFNTKVSVVSGSLANTTQWQSFDVGTRSDLDLHPGQTVVVGNTNVAGNSALFIVLSAKLVD